MNPTLSPTTAFLLHPTVVLAEILSGIREALRAFRHVEEADSRHAPPTDTLAGLSEHVLRDIGAPVALIAQAAARRKSSQGDELLWPSYSRFE